MSKIVLFLCVALLVGSVISASPGRTRSSSSLTADTQNCGRHGDPCVSADQCCGTLRCHTYAHRCQVVITEAEILAQREKILGRRGKDN
ncbi:omega-conotoxin-like protein 1 [Athalia rosae]|uniref:omega-conotoxin-like protein 1 n=1 Tax=Athalia rosae TaxID=37344 RepID=UPI00203372D5|nr:omega-conotoxin-like protein 1 [Athalia rosae]XP_048509303.1 omega-conotoxin-like protein 1 [Athalia rosae]